MLTTHPGTVDQKKDLHVGGLGLNASGPLAAVSVPVNDAVDSWFARARHMTRDTDDYVRGHPWAALAAAAAAGLAAGYLLSRRS
jgi:ElaB/YqjD/DUF883 family membrane-anchored ribosome-binding protein